MTNTVDIVEVTLAQAADSTNAVNTDGWWDRPHVIRITDHVSNVTAEVGSDTDKMAIFERKAIGHPWMRRGTRLHNVIHDAGAGGTIPTNVEVLYPDWDYGDFE